MKGIKRIRYNKEQYDEDVEFLTIKTCDCCFENITKDGIYFYYKNGDDDWDFSSTICDSCFEGAVEHEEQKNMLCSMMSVDENVLENAIQKYYQKKPRLILDMDGVLVDLLPTYLDYYNILFGDNIKSSDIKNWRIKEYVCDKAKPYIENIFKLPKFYENLEPTMPAQGLDNILWQIQEHYDIIVVTDPFVKEDKFRFDIIEQKKQWIATHLNTLNNVPKFFTGNKGLYEGDVMIDDNPEHLYSFLKTNPNGLAICFNTPVNLNADLPENIIRVDGWIDVVDKLKQYVERR